MADLIDALEGLKRPKHRHKLVSVLLKLEANEANALQTALEDPAYSSESLARALRASGHSVGVSSVKRYRRDVLGLSYDN